MSGRPRATRTPLGAHPASAVENGDPTEERIIETTRTTTRRRRSSARSARLIAVTAAALLVVALCGWIPGVVGTAASTVLPFLGLVLVVLSALALVLVPRVLPVLLIPALVWGLAMLPSAPAVAAAGATGAETLQVVSQNVRAHSGGAASSATEIAATGADVIALTELDGESLAAARSALATDYPHSYAVGTVGVWSRYPLVDAEALSLGLDWKRALRVVVATPRADVAVYVMHAASVRPGMQEERDTMLTGIADAAAADPHGSIVVVGDFNAASTDPALDAIRSRLDWVRPTDGSLGFTWPAGMPLARIDHAFVRGMDVLESTTMRAGESDHLATVVELEVR